MCQGCSVTNKAWDHRSSLSLFLYVKGKIIALRFSHIQNQMIKTFTSLLSRLPLCYLYENLRFIQFFLLFDPYHNLPASLSAALCPKSFSSLSQKFDSFYLPGYLCQQPDHKTHPPIHHLLQDTPCRVYLPHKKLSFSKEGRTLTAPISSC